MAGVPFTELQSRPMEFLDFTSVTLDEFQQLVPPFETAFQCHMAAWRMDGKLRTARRFTVYKTCPLPTPFKCRLFSYATLGSGGKVRSRAKVVAWLLGHSSGSMAPMGKG